jgi:hypothetical protein
VSPGSTSAKLLARGIEPRSKLDVAKEARQTDWSLFSVETRRRAYGCSYG